MPKRSALPALKKTKTKVGKFVKKHKLPLAVGTVAALGAAAYLLTRGGGAAPPPCTVEGSTICQDGMPYECVGGKWVQKGSGCSNDPCTIKECPGWCSGPDLMGTGVPRCVNIGGEATCQYIMVEPNSRYCQLRYPANIFVEINGQAFDPGWIYQGGPAYCAVPCDGSLSAYNGKNGVDMDVRIIINDQWGEPLPGCRTVLRWTCEENLMAALQPMGPGLHCSNQYWICSPNAVVIWSNELGWIWRHFTQIGMGRTGTIYRLILEVTIEDPNGVREPITRDITIKFAGLGGGVLDNAHTCQYPHAYNPGGC